MTNTYGFFWVNTCTRNHRSNHQCRNVTKEMVEVEGSPTIPSRARRVGHAGWFQSTLWFTVLPALYGLMSVHCCLYRNPENSLTFTRFYSTCCCWYKANICAHKESRCKRQIGAHTKWEVWDQIVANGMGNKKKWHSLDKGCYTRIVGTQWSKKNSL